MYVVTGGAGFIGSNIVKGLNDRGIKNILVVDDLTEGKKCLNLSDFSAGIQKINDIATDQNQGVNILCLIA